MLRKIAASILVLAMMLYGVSVSAKEDDHTNTNDIVIISDSESVLIQYTHNLSLSSFNNDSEYSFGDTSLIVINETDLKRVNAYKLLELIDDGITLYINGSHGSISDICDQLGINYSDHRFVSGATIVGTGIFNINGEYCLCLVGTVECNPVNWNTVFEEASESFMQANCYAPTYIGQGKDSFPYRIEEDYVDRYLNLDDFVNSVISFRADYSRMSVKEPHEDKVYLQLPAKTFDGTPYYNYFALTQYGFQFGSASITQYRYDICTQMDGTTLKAIADIVSTFTISPYSTMYVNNYLTRMHANITNMDVIGQSYLNSNSSTSYTLSGGFSVTPGQVVTGTAEASTTNTYDTNSQTIVNDFFAQKYKNWNSEPTTKWIGQSWELEPCIRIVNTDANTYMSSAYSSFRSGGWIGVQNVIGYTSPTVEVGGAWNAA